MQIKYPRESTGVGTEHLWDELAEIPAAMFQNLEEAFPAEWRLL